MADPGAVPTLPENAQRFSSPDALFRHLEEYHGISTTTASGRLHALKQKCGYGAPAELIFDHTGNVYDPETLEWVGSLTEGGQGKS